MILLWGVPGDGPLDAAKEALASIDAPMVVVDQRDVLETDGELLAGPDLKGCLSFKGCTVDLMDVSAAYLRPYDARQLAPIARAGPGSSEWLHAERLDALLWTWADLAPGCIVSRPSAMGATSSKPYQAARILAAGFAVPDTLVTTDRDAVLDFWERHGVVVYKSISGVRSIVSRLTREHCGRLSDVAFCPTQFQEYVAGVDHRVHVVGEAVFCSRIESTADDYRYGDPDGGATVVAPVELPDDCVRRCRALAAALGLPVAGIDLRVTADGVWYCFEVNPSPAFTFYDREPGYPIAGAIAALLADSL